MRNMFGKESDDKKFAVILKDILLPFFVYYFVYFLADIVLLSLTDMVENASTNAGGILADFFLRYEATVRGIAGGIAMLIGTVPLFASFKKETGIEKERIEKAERAGAQGQDGGHKSRGIVPVRVLLTLFLAVSASLAINILFIRMGILESSEAYTQTAENQYSVIFPIGIFLYGVVSPLAEEIAFRGIIYNRMKKYFRTPLAAIVLSALLFGIYHGNFVQAVYGFCMGALLAYVYEVFGRFFYAFLFHAAANAAVYTVTGNLKLYEWIVTPYAGLVFGGIAVVLLLVMGNWRKRKCIHNN